MISGWEGSPYDLRRKRPVAVPDNIRRVVLPAEVGATLHDLQLVDSDTERLIFRTQAFEGGALLINDERLIEFEERSEAAACGACALGRVEGEEARLQFFETQ